MVIAFFEHLVEAEIAAFDQMCINGGPFGKDDRFASGGFHGERIATEDVMTEDVADGFACFIVGLLGAVFRVFPVEDFEHSLAAFFGVIGQELNAVDTGDGDDGITFIIKRVFAVAPFDDIEFTAQYLSQKITVATGGFEKTAVNTFGLVFYQVEHGIDFSLGGEDFAMVSHALL